MKSVIHQSHNTTEEISITITCTEYAQNMLHLLYSEMKPRVCKYFTEDNY